MDSDTLIIPGAAALPAFRIDRLLGAIRTVYPGVTGLSARFVHFVHLARPLDPVEREHLDRLLRYGHAPASGQASVALSLLVVPRLGTISPWSSKATDIARNCGLDAVLRIERGVEYAIEADATPPATTLEAVAPLLHDRMTETVLPREAGPDALFAEAAPSALVRIALDGDAAGALADANRRLGLALSPEEIAYLAAFYGEAGRDPSDAELMMFAQANSEHCRHKIFNAGWVIDGEEKSKSLFAMIRNTSAVTPGGLLSAYRDNAAVIEGRRAGRFFADANRVYGFRDEDVHILMKVETHNHPTAISPFPGAATGSGGEIRDEGATGRGARPKAGLTGFSVSHLKIPDFVQPWETDHGKPDRIVSALDIMIEGPIGAASFNNEFGRPNLCGYFRTFEQSVGEGDDALVRGYHKPIMIAGGMGNIRAGDVEKCDIPPDAPVVVLGGPAMLIGLGGGAASSMTSGQSDEDLDFASVQRGNPEIQRRAQEVIDACWAMGHDNPVLLIHDVGAGGLSNAVPEALDHSHLGGRISLRAVPSAERRMSPMEIWCNEAQERYVLVLAPGTEAAFAELCRRERCPHAVIGHTTAERRLVVEDDLLGDRPVDMPMEVLLGNTPRMHRDTAHPLPVGARFDTAGIDTTEALHRVLSMPAVADKRFLITIGDRTVGGLVSRDQMVGPWQVPVSDVAVTCASFEGYLGEAMAMGERTPLALIDAPASGRLAVTEAILNIAAADIDALSDVRLSANWMAAASRRGDDAALFDTVEAVGEQFCPALGIAIPVGKDSLSMHTGWSDADGDHQVTAPVSLIVSAFAPVADVRRTLTPQLKALDTATTLTLVDLSAGRQRLGASCLAQAYSSLGQEAPDMDDPARLRALFEAVRDLSRAGLLLAYHDRSDGGLAVTLLEMAFAARCGLAIDIGPLGGDPIAALFNEEPGVVLQTPADRGDEVAAILARHGVDDLATALGAPDASGRIGVRSGDTVLVDDTVAALHAEWSQTSTRLQARRDNPACAAEEMASIADPDAPGLFARVTYDPGNDIAAPFVATGVRPRVAILREQGVNGHVEMAAAFHRAGFDSVDVHMSDVVSGAQGFADFHGIAACGGFSYGDVLGAGEGWARTILYNGSARAAFASFFERTDTFTLGVCNGCQMLAALKDLVPGAGHWPRFGHNRSEQFEARLSLVEVTPGPSIFLRGMAGSVLPVAVSHGEGRAEFSTDADRAAARDTLGLCYVDNRGEPTQRYPANPNGSVDAIAGLCNADGRVTIMMPHPERVYRTVQHSWHPAEWGEDGPWLRMFRNARTWLG